MTNRKKFWRAIYNDGTVLKQVNGTIENKFGDIDLSRLNKFELVSNNGFIYSINLNPSRTLIYFVRVTGSISNGEIKTNAVHHIGYKENDIEYVQKISD